MKYHYLIVGSGLFGSVFARQMTDKGKKCLIIEKRNHIAGNCYTEKQHNIDIHKYGPHIFHTNNLQIWEYINQFTKFNKYIHTPIAKTGGKIYPLPFNMHTYYNLWGITTPHEAYQKINSQQYKENPTNCEQQALNTVGTDIYNTLIKGYTQKQWQTEPKHLPASIIKRIPHRYTYNNNYFDDTYQGIPIDGYTAMFNNLLDGIQVELETDYLNNQTKYNRLANQIVYTGKLDEYFQNCYGKLNYRSLEFKHKTINTDNYQGVSQINYPDLDIPYTRTIEHKHFNYKPTTKTIITEEYSTTHNQDNEPYYPINDEQNNKLYEKYTKLLTNTNIIIGGRLAEYKYYDMHQVIASAILKTNKILQRI